MQQLVQANRSGQVIGYRYRLVSELGSGGQGTVYRGLDLRDGDEVAIKVMEPAPHDIEWRERTFREAHALTVLTGTSAVRVLHQAWTDDGAFCIVMELLKGVDFGEIPEKPPSARYTYDSARSNSNFDTHRRNLGSSPRSRNTAPRSQTGERIHIGLGRSTSVGLWVCQVHSHAPGNASRHGRRFTQLHCPRNMGKCANARSADRRLFTGGHNFSSASRQTTVHGR